MEGTPLYTEPTKIVLQIGTKNSPPEAAVDVLAHEIIHVMNKKSRMSEVLQRISERTGLNAEEAFVSTITNLVLWRARRSDKMFSKYYEPNWPELCELEDKMREIVREWWVNGGNLRKMIEGRLTGRV